MIRLLNCHLQKHVQTSSALKRKAPKPYKDVTSGTVYTPSRLVTQRIKPNLISPPANPVQRTQRGESPDE